MRDKSAWNPGQVKAPLLFLPFYKIKKIKQKIKGTNRAVNPKDRVKGNKIPESAINIV